MPLPKLMIIASPLKAWPGSISLPEPDDFNGIHWRAWKNAINKPNRQNYALTHLYCYAGLELIKAVGEWKFEVALEDAMTWELEPEKERVKLVAWIGREMMSYMDGIMDPKE